MRCVSQVDADRWCDLDCISGTGSATVVSDDVDFVVEFFVTAGVFCVVVAWDGRG